MRIIPRAEWGARPPTNRSTVPRSQRHALVVHYDDARPTTRTGAAAMRATQNFHMDGRGWADIGYNFLIDQEGNVFEGRGFDVLGAHAGASGNVVGIGVQVHIGGDQQPSAAALSALVWLKGQADAHCGKTLAWRKHNDYMSTSCPGGPLTAWLAAGAPASSAPDPSPTPSWDGSSFPGAGAFVIGQSHPAVTLLGQRLVAHGYTGYQVGPGSTFTEVDKRGVREFQERQGWTGSGADGIPGPQTWDRLMADPSSPVPAPTPAPSVPVLALDHVIAAVALDSADSNPTDRVNYGDPAGSRALEQALADLGYDPGPIDGSLGTSFKRAYARWQRRLGYSGADADGIPGRASLVELGNRTGRFTVA